MSKKSYICMKCGETGLYHNAPKFCPYCGSEEIQRNNLDAIKHAKEVALQMEELVPVVEKAWSAYVDVYVEFENRRRVLEDYCRRGAFDKGDIPTVEKKKLLDALYEYRARRKNEQGHPEN